MKYTHRVKRAIAVGAAGAMMLTLSPVGVASADMHEPVCDDAGDSPFVDISGNTFEEEIECLFHYGITTGTTATTYSPGNPVQRGQMATFIVNAIEVAADAEMDEPTEDQFPDTSGNVHHDNINKLGHAGIVTGFPDGTYKATRTVSRGQMATFVAGAIEFHLDEEMARPASDVFPDISGNVHRDNINKLGNAGIVQGYGDGTFRASRDVTRGEMSKFIAWALGHWHANDAFAPTRDTTVSAAAVPQLVSAAIVSTTTDGTTVRYTFDRNVTNFASVPGRFKVWEFDGTVRSNGTIVARDGSMVDVRFSDYTSLAASPRQVADLSLATVETGAVVGDNGRAGAEGDAAIGTGRGETLAAGVTSAPDLVSSQNFRPTPGVANSERIDLTFDEAAWIHQGGARVRVILLNGEVVDCAPVAAPGELGEGTTTLSYDCAYGANIRPTPSNTARVAILEDTVRDGAAAPPATNTNVLQVAELASSGNETGAPNLVSAAIDTTNHRVRYTFDRAVDHVAGQNFRAYRANATEVTSNTLVAGTPATNTTQLTVQFTAGELDEAVGASVFDGAVIATAGAAPNKRDEVAAQNPRSTALEAGNITNPQLVSATVQVGANPFGDPENRIVYTFDKNVSVVAGSTSFHFYTEDGTRYTNVAGSCAVTPSTATTSTTIACTNFNTTQANIAAAVLATVSTGAVTDSTNQNPEGAAVIR